jgi:alkyl sulfatase BDS1-like metallo-beta-lactamase superfamily hydrolase
LTHYHLKKWLKRFVDAVGGHSAAVDIATQAIENDDLQWAATILSYLVFSDKENQGYRGLLALVFRHIGFREESGIMRNFYLTGALELEDGVKPVPMAGGRNADLAATLSVTDWFDAFALRLNPEKASGLTLQIDFLVDGKKVSLSVERQTEFARIFDDMQESQRQNT